MSAKSYPDAMSVGTEYFSPPSRRSGWFRLAFVVCFGCALSWLLVGFGVTPLVALALIPCYGAVSFARFQRQERRRRQAAAGGSGS